MFIDHKRKGNAYWLTRNRNGETNSSPAISSLTLNPGNYCLSFNGGRNGGIRLAYTLVP